MFRIVAIAMGLSALAACSTTGGAARTADVPGTEAAYVLETHERYAALLARLDAGDAGALVDLERFSADHPGASGPLVTLGIARANAGDDAGALRYLERATAVCSSHCGPAFNELGVQYRRQGRFADAEQAYIRAIEAEASYAPVYYNLAVLYELYLPRPELALQNYERYLEAGGTADSQDVEKWVADLRRRVGAKTAAAGSTS